MFDSQAPGFRRTRGRPCSKKNSRATLVSSGNVGETPETGTRLLSQSEGRVTRHKTALTNERPVSRVLSESELHDEISEVVMSEPGDIVIGPQYGVYPPVDSILPSDITVRADAVRRPRGRPRKYVSLLEKCNKKLGSKRNSGNVRISVEAKTVSKTNQCLDMSVTVFDSDVARPSRPILRPVRYFDTVHQSDNIAIRRLGIVDKQELPYDPESLVWNKQHSRNKQNVYCYCGGGGVWHCKMVQCVRCCQWFHERCLAPRPYNMPIIPGDSAWLFVCSLCNSGSECLKRMDLSWSDIVHLALYDITLKTSRRYHHLAKDLVPHILTNWPMFQLSKHHNSLSQAEKESKISECLRSDTERFMSGVEDSQDGELWSLRRLVPPPRSVFAVSHPGIVTERTVLAEVSLVATWQHDRTQVFMDQDRLVNNYKDYSPTTLQDNTPPSTLQSKPVKQKKKLKILKKKQKNLKKKSSQMISDLRRKSKKALKLPKTKVQETKLPPLQKKRGRKRKLVETAKPLPYEIARILHSQGYPKVAVKFASIVPPKPQQVWQNIQEQEKAIQVEEKKSKSRKEKDVTSDAQNKSLSSTNQSSVLTNQSSLSSLIPEKSDYLGDNNPFYLGSVEEQREARKLICNRKLRPEDLTNCRSKLKKRKYRLNFEQARKVWKKGIGEKTQSRRNFVSKAALQFAGNFTAPSGSKKLLVFKPESQDSIQIEM